ncbi:MAG: four-carbon acid sugar kinase family protein [Beijerinckiaceae bacterium]|nr:four-carbon acid sugar kinase family protein [Beijerinckiaceae bacterium]
MAGLALGCIADDYTGASDLANTLTRCGLRTVQTIGVPSPDLALPEIDAVVVALKSRSIPAAEAVEKSLAANAWLQARGVRHVMFKVCSTFDSTDEGNIGPVMDALGSALNAGTVIVTPAFPGTGRTVYQGNLFVGSVPLNESPLKDHPLNPMRDANLVRVLARQSKGRIGLLDLATVARGVEVAKKRLEDLVGEGCTAAIVDAVFDSDLEILGALALDQPFSVGASGLGLGLARAMAGKSGSSSVGATTGSPIAGPTACLAGSCSQATLAQITNSERSMPVRRLDPEALLNGNVEVESALDWARNRMKDGPILIASSSSPAEVTALQARFGRDRLGHAIEQAMADIAEGLARSGVRKLVVAGGETSGAVVDRLGLKAFLLGGEIAPGVPVLRSIGAGDDMLMALKSGNFGGPDFFRDAIAMLNA